MGTVARINFLQISQGVTKPLVTVQFDYDGPHNVAKAIEYISTKTMVNGLGSGNFDRANGLGCLSALVIAKFKTMAGSVYIEPYDASCGDYTCNITSDITGTNLIIEIDDGLKSYYCEVDENDRPVFPTYLKDMFEGKDVMFN